LVVRAFARARQFEDNAVDETRWTTRARAETGEPICRRRARAR
jgi:hypothetical protein